MLRLTKPLEFAFTGMILASFDGGFISDCISIFDSMKDYCTPNIGTINVMLKVYGRCDMFGKAKDLFETTTYSFSSSQPHIHGHSSLKADAYTYSSILEASASAQQWEYFENVYRQMTLTHHHLDQRKYSWLLIDASRAGKVCLLSTICLPFLRYMTKWFDFQNQKLHWIIVYIMILCKYGLLITVIWVHH